MRERPEDVPALLEYFLREIGEQVGRPAAGVSREARDKLLAYAWPGNVRELRNAVEEALERFARALDPRLQKACLHTNPLDQEI